MGSKKHSANPTRWVYWSSGNHFSGYYWVGILRDSSSQ